MPLIQHSLVEIVDKILIENKYMLLQSHQWHTKTGGLCSSLNISQSYNHQLTRIDCITLC